MIFLFYLDIADPYIKPDNTFEWIIISFILLLLTFAAIKIMRKIKLNNNNHES